MANHTPAIDLWMPSGIANYDRSIHSNPDAKAWAYFFVEVFPGLKDKHELMHGWFANAMMAMHDHIHSQPNPLSEQLAAITAQRDELIDELDTTKKALAMAVNTGPDSLLELAKKDIGYYMTEAVKTVTAQRDELLAALKQYADDENWCYDTCNIGRGEAKKAIAKCEVQNG